jgi:glycosyltransferase involved in cell wall biosynthesis
LLIEIFGTKVSVKRMNILFVTDFFQPHIGGVEKLFSSLTGKLAEKGDLVTCITWRYDKLLASTEWINGVKVIRISSPSRFLFSMTALGTIIKEARNVDLIHTSTYSSAIGSWVAAKLLKKKIIITVHEFWGDLWLKLPYLTNFEKRIFMFFEKCLFQLKFTKYIAVSDFTKKSLIKKGIKEEKIVRIYNGIEYNLPLWSDRGLPFTFTYFGRTGASKGLNILIEASERILETHTDINFKFILSPQSEKVFNRVTQQIRNGNLNRCSRILTELPYPNLIEELLTSHCIVIPSYSEGFGFTTAETCAMNIPLISSGMGSLPEIVSGNVITMSEFSSNALFLAMENAIKNQFIYYPLKKYTVDDFIQNHLVLYDQIIKMKI